MPKELTESIFAKTLRGFCKFPSRITGIRNAMILVFVFLLPSGVIDQLTFAQPLEENGPLTLVDLETGLMWQKDDSFHELKKGLNWYEALEYVDRKNAESFGGHQDWRLPTLPELHHLWVLSRPLKSKEGELLGLPEGFKEGGSYYLWTGNERGMDNAWYFGLGQKEEYFNLKDLSDLDQSVKMVRNEK